MLTEYEITERLTRIVIDLLDVDEEEVTPNAHFAWDLGADSLDLVELVMKVEEEFNLEIPDEDAVTVSTMREAINFIASRT